MDTLFLKCFFFFNLYFVLVFIDMFYREHDSYCI